MLPAPLNQLEDYQTKSVSYDKSQMLFRQGDKTRGVFYIVEGLVELKRYSPSGDTIVIHTANAKETFAEASLFSKSYHCDAQAVTQTSVIEIKKDRILKLFREDEQFAIALTERFASQIQNYRRKIELLAIRDATERVYAAFNEGLLSSNIKSFASEIGLSHEVVYRSLSALVKQGKLNKVGRGQFTARETKNSA